MARIKIPYLLTSPPPHHHDETASVLAASGSGRIRDNPSQGIRCKALPFRPVCRTAPANQQYLYKKKTGWEQFPVKVSSYYLYWHRRPFPRTCMAIGSDNTSSFRHGHVGAIIPLPRSFTAWALGMHALLIVRQSDHPELSKITLYFRLVMILSSGGR